MKKINIGIIGCGTVGSTVIDILDKHSDVIKKRVGCDIHIKSVCDKNMSRVRESGLPERVAVADYSDIVDDPEIDIVVELIGGTGLAKKIVFDAIRRKKHVVTANKALISENWHELFSAAHANKVLVYFEASVGAGIPVIQALNEGLAANNRRTLLRMPGGRATAGGAAEVSTCRKK